MGRTTDLDVGRLVTAYKNGASASSLARPFGVSTWTILNRLRSAGVTIRTNQQERRLDLSERQQAVFRQIVDGLLLGDGGIGRKGELRLEQVNRRLGWIYQIQQQLKELGGESRLVPVPVRQRMIEGRPVTSQPATLLYTPCYVELQAERRRWYPRGVRWVPRDLKLTPLAVSHWFAGDGTYDTGGALFFCTNGFPQADTEFLIELMVDLGIKARCTPTQREGQFKVAITERDEAMKLKELVGPRLPKCCLYKLRHVRPAKPRGQHARKLTFEQVREIRRRAHAGETQTHLARALGVSQATVSAIVRRKVYSYVQ